MQVEQGNTADQPRVQSSPDAGLRVLHVITDLDIGGAEQMLRQVAVATARDPDKVVVASLLSGGAHAEPLRKAGVAVVELDFKHPLRALVGIVRLARLIRRFKPHVVQGWMYHGDLAALIALVISGHRARSALVWGIRCSNLDLTQYGIGLRCVVGLCALLSRWPDIVTANSEAGMAAHRALGYRPRRAVVLDNGIDTDVFRPDPEGRAAIRRELGIDENTVVLAMVARTDAMKNHAQFLAAMKALPEMQGLLMGAGTERLSPPGNVRALGRRTDVARLLPACDFIVSSSFGEGFSNAIAEGMACGLPAIATDVGDARRIIGETGAIVPARDLNAMIDAIRRLAGESAGQHAARAEEARARIVRNFSLSTAINRFSACYRSALSQNGVRD